MVQDNAACTHPIPHFGYPRVVVDMIFTLEDKAWICRRVTDSLETPADRQLSEEILDSLTELGGVREQGLPLPGQTRCLLFWLHLVVQIHNLDVRST